LDELIEKVKKWFRPKPDPDPQPSNPCAGYTIRLKTYKGPDYYKDRRFSCKLDKRFYHDQGCRGDNTKVYVDGEELKFYGIDQENGRMDLSFCDKKRKHTDLPKPVRLLIQKLGEDLCEVLIDEWEYKAVTVPGEQPDPQPDEPPDGATNRIELKGWNERGITFSGDARSWPERPPDLSGEAILEIFRDGKWQGGKFEHCRNHMTYRGWENIKHHNPAHNQPYGVFKNLRPKVGERARFRLISYDKKYFTNWLEGTWK
jgi:hypothetical protein